MAVSQVIPYSKQEVDQAIDTHAATQHGTTVGEQSILSASDTHMAQTDNPHAVTATQVGTYSAWEIDERIADAAYTNIDGGTP